MKKILTLGTVSAVVASLLIGCGSSDDDSTSSSSETDSATTEIGYFIDSPVAGAEYQTSSGQSGITDAYGRFQFNAGDTVKFSIGKLDLGETTPNSDGLVTPEALANGDENVKLTILRVLQALDEDDNPSNGITIPSEVLASLDSLDQEISISSLQSDGDILAIDNSLAQELDEDYDGEIDISADTAEQHYTQSLTAWENREQHGNNDATEQGHVGGSDNGQQGHGEENGNGQEHVGGSDNGQQGHGEENGNAEQQRHGEENSNGDGECQEDSNQTHGQNGALDINSYPLSTLTQELKDAIAYMGNEERLAHDVYTNLYNYHVQNSGVSINQLKNIADRSETTHVQTVQSIVRRYNISDENLTNVTNPVADNQTAFEELPSGVYDIPAIQSLYDALYEKGIQSQRDALEVGCMVEVTDINDLNDRIIIAQESNATDVVDAFTNLRDASYNHYWAFDKGLQNIGVAEGCCSLGTIDGVNYCHLEYPQNEHEESNSSQEQSQENQGQGQRNGQGNGQGQRHGRS